MAHKNIQTLVFAGFEPNVAAKVVTMMGDDNLPMEIRFLRGLNIEPWHNIRSGLMVVGMDPTTDLVRVSQLIQNRTTYWDVAVAIPLVLSYYSVALLAQGAVKVLPHPSDNPDATASNLKSLLRNLASLQSDAFGLEVSDLIQLYGEKRIAKTIRLTGDGCVGSIFLHNGDVVHAETMDEETGMEAFRRLISLNAPEIRVHMGLLTDQRTVGMNAMSALLEGSRQVDEQRNSQDSDFDSFDSVDLELREDFASMDAIPKLDPSEFFRQPANGERDSGSTRGNVPPAPKEKFDPLKNLFGDDDDFDLTH